MTEKRFQVHKVIGSFHEWSIADIIDDTIVFDGILHKYNAERFCAKLNELSEQADAVRTELQLCEEENNELQKENEQLRKDCTTLVCSNQEYRKANEQLKSDLKSYQNRVKQYISIHIDRIRRRYVNPTKEEVAERTRIIRDLEQLKKELQE